MTEHLFFNILTFKHPAKPVRLYFSTHDDAERKSTRLKSSVLIPKEVRQSTKFPDLFAGKGAPILYTSFDLPTDGFEPVDIDFNEPENRYLVKRYYNRRLELYFRYYQNIVVTKSNITQDLQIWRNKGDAKQRTVNYHGKQLGIMEMDRFTLRVKYDTFNKRPYLLVANDRPALLLNEPLSRILGDDSDNPFGSWKNISASMINKVMTRETRTNDKGEEYVVRRIDKYEFLQKNNKYCPPESTRPIMGGELKRFFGLDTHEEPRSLESKYVTYFEKIEAFRRAYLNSESIEKIFHGLAYSFTRVEPSQLGKADSSKRMLVFGRDANGNPVKNVRQQYGVNHGPHIKCPYTDVKLIAIYHKSDKQEAAKLLGYFRNGNYGATGNQMDERLRKRLGKYIGTNVAYADLSMHIEFSDKANPVKEIEQALNGEAYRRLNPKVKYVGIYVSPIHKYASAKEAKECYYKIKELFLRHNIPTQCIDSEKMKCQLGRDSQKNRTDFLYTLQNMGVAICAKLGGSPWLLDEPARKEMIIGIGAFRSDNKQYIGAAFSFDSTGVFNDYSYYQKSELGELVGAIKMAIINYTHANSTPPDRIIIHYYKKISRKREFKKMEDMLHSLRLNVPVYVVTINKTLSEDIVMFDDASTYPRHNYTSGTDEAIKGLMPYSGRWVNLGQSNEGHRFLLCNNTRYEGEKFSVMDGFPFPVKLTIACPNHDDKIDPSVVHQLINQVYQFSRIYWKSVKQQGLPVTIKYPEMIAEIMPHFEDKTIYTDSNSLWFL